MEWRLDYIGNGEYRIVSMTSTANIMYVLDVYTNDNSNGANVDIFLDSDSPDRRWSIQLNSDNCSYRILSKCSNYTKGVSVSNASCDDKANVVQYDYSSNPECEWLFEPVNGSAMDLAVNYALTNYNSYFYTYPGLRGEDIGTDCTNFASQCMLANGVHFQDEWWIYKKNNNNPYPQNSTQFDSSWDVETIGGILGFGASSPWISAPKFYDFWSNKVTYVDYTAEEILANPAEIFSEECFKGDIISSVNSNGYATHTFFISGYGVYNGSRTYMLTYHAENTQSKSLLEIAESDQTRTFRLYFFNSFID